MGYLLQYPAEASRQLLSQKYAPQMMQGSELAFGNEIKVSKHEEEKILDHKTNTNIYSFSGKT